MSVPRVDPDSFPVVSEPAPVPVMTDDQALVLIDGARRQLEQARSLSDITTIIDRMAALKYLTKKAGCELVVKNEATALYIDTQTAGGRILAEMKAAGEYGPGGVPMQRDSALPHRNVTHRWQDMARVPAEAQREYVDNQTAKGKEATSAEIQRMGAHIRREEEEARRMAEAREAEAKPVVELSDCIPWLKRQKPCDILLTDPPYATDVDDVAAFAESWLPLALNKVKPTGRAYICVGAYPAELHAYLTILLRHGWESQVLAWYYPDTLGPNPAKCYKSVWQAVLYTWGPEAAPLRGDTLTEKTTVQKFNMNSGIDHGRQHSWQKPDGLAERLIKLSSDPGDTVLDPFTGTGTFLLQAAKLGRVAKGCEMDPDMLEIAVRRGCLHE